MNICPVCKRKYSEPPALSRRDNKTNICSVCATKEALGAAGIDYRKGTGSEIVEAIKQQTGYATPQERTRAAVMRTGNKWAIENFNATHN